MRREWHPLSQQLIHHNYCADIQHLGGSDILEYSRIYIYSGIKLIERTLYFYIDDLSWSNWGRACGHEKRGGIEVNSSGEIFW